MVVQGPFIKERGLGSLQDLNFSCERTVILGKGRSSYGVEKIHLWETAGEQSKMWE